MLALRAREKQLLQGQITQLQSQLGQLNAHLLLSDQVAVSNQKSLGDEISSLKEDIQEMKENIDRKEYLMQHSDEKYNQYEKTLRELILNPKTSPAVKDQLRHAIDKENLFVPVDERKVINVVTQNKELKEQLETIRGENTKLRCKLEEVLNRGGQNVN